MGYSSDPKVDLVWGEQLVTTSLTRWRHLVTRLIPMRREVFHIFITLEKSEIRFHPILIICVACLRQHSTTFPRFFQSGRYPFLIRFQRKDNIQTCQWIKQDKKNTPRNTHSVLILIRLHNGRGVLILSSLTMTSPRLVWWLRSSVFYCVNK